MRHGQRAVARSFGGSEIDERLALKALREVILPLSVGVAGQRAGRSVAEPAMERLHVLGGGAGAAGVADEVDDEVTLADVVGELVEEGKAALLEVFLYLDVIRMTFQRAQMVGQLQAVRFELQADAGEEEIHGSNWGMISRAASKSDRLIQLTDIAVAPRDGLPYVWERATWQSKGL